MNKELATDLDQLSAILETVKLQGLDYLDVLTERPTSTYYTINQNKELAEKGVGTLGALKNFNSRLEPLMVASSGPRYWGYVTGGTTPAAIAGDWLASIYDQNTQITHGQGGASAMIETETIQLLLDLLQLPRIFFGGFVTGATMSNFTCLAVARQWLGKMQGKDVAIERLSQHINILTATPHSSVLKSLSLLGIGSNNIIPIKTMQGNREAINIIDFEEKIYMLKGEPFILIGSGGTVNSVDFDDFEAIAKLKQQHHFWWHIDAAFGAFAACSTKHQHLLNGWEFADSITIDCHKWLNVPYENAVFLVNEKYSTLQVATFQNANAPYLGNPMEHFNYLNFLPENSRRLKALPVWFTLMAYGKAGMREVVDGNIQSANQFGEFIIKNTAFELLAPVRLNTVCFTLADIANQDNVNHFLEKLNETGKVFMTPTTYRNRKGIRAAFVNWRTTPEDIQQVIDLMTRLIDLPDSNHNS